MAADTDTDHDSVTGNDIAQYLRALESREDLFAWHRDGLAVWPLIRFHLYRQVSEALERTDQAHSDVSLSLLESVKGGYLWARNLVRKNPYLEQAEIICFGSARRKLLDDGLWWDIYSDPILDAAAFDWLQLEAPYLNSHKTPAKTERLSYLDLIIYTGTICRTLGIFEETISTAERNRIEQLSAQIQEEFGVSIDIQPLLHEKLTNHKIRKPLFSRLVERVNPRLAITSRSYGREAYIHACSDHDIPVVELQHGIIHENHLAFHYPDVNYLPQFPDYMLLWGEFWKQNVSLPLPEDRLFVVGYPYLETRVTEYDDVESTKQILFISQGPVGTELSKFATRVAEEPRIGHDIVYKLHPGEYDRWQTAYPWLVDSEIEVIDQDQPPLYELFARSSVQIGVGSTAVVEGLCFDLETYIYDCPDAELLEPLVADGAATKVASVDELDSYLGTTSKSFNREYYFERSATENAIGVLDELREAATPYRPDSSR